MGNGYAFKGDDSVKLFLPAFWKEIYSKMKEFAPLSRANSFHLE